ncbi:MAG: anti-sigma factor [Crocinitomix sp.]|nr:anti-sigma factor [Crocinitomix sp.]
MRAFKKIILLTFASLFIFTSCKKEGTANLELRLQNLPHSDYEGWIIVDNKPISIGQFTGNQFDLEDGGAEVMSFDVDKKLLKAATSFMITVENPYDNNPYPSDYKFLGGDFEGDNLTLSTNHPNGIGIDLSLVDGAYWIATPTDNSLEIDEKAGVWFYYPGGMDEPTLYLPELDNNWTYEASVSNCSLILPIGKFDKVRGADDRNNFGDHDFAPGFPGEDFIRSIDEHFSQNYSFPIDLSSFYLRITISPKMGDQMGNFLTILTSEISENMEAHGIYPMENKPASAFEFGSVTRN